MKKNSKNIGDYVNIAYPILIALLFMVIDIHWKFTYKIKGYSSVLESIITFSSIVIGFYTAMYGILITMKSTTLMTEIRQRNLNGIFKFQLYDSLLISFIVLLLSIIMQIVKNYSGSINNFVFDIWFVIIGYFVGSTYRAISLLLKIIFADEQKKPKIQKKTPAEKKKQWERIGTKK